MGKYLSPLSYLTFKKVFGRHPDLLISLLNALLPLSEEQQIDAVEYLPLDLMPENPFCKTTFMNVRCKDISGRQFIVEIQLECTTYFLRRISFNDSKVYVCQATEGDAYRKFQPIYSLNLIDEVFRQDISEYRHDYSIVHDKYSDKIIEGLHFTFIELPKFTPQSYAEKRMAVLWLRYLTEIDSRTRSVSSELLEDPVIGKALNELRKSAFTEAELAAYDKYWDIVRTERTLAEGKLKEGRAEGHAEGLQEGLEKGLEKGRAEGLAEGLEKGMAVGMEKERLEMARKMKAHGVSFEIIAATSGLSPEEIEQL